EPTLQAPIAAFEAFDRRDSGWIKVKLRPAKRTQDGSEEQIHSSPALDRVIADASPYHEARSEKPGHL
ncbi:MAG TPA: hypothetical protein VN156_13035, partial [Pseudomonas sp.]|nr:hypothetical protein [Pseudomonas sp.]